MIGSRPHISHTSPRLPDPGGEAGIALAFIAVPVIWTGFALPLAVAEITVEAVFFALVGAACSGMTLAGFRLIYLRHATQEIVVMREGESSRPAEIVSFWEDAGLDRWFAVDTDFDDSCRQRLLADHLAAARRERDDWGQSPHGALALLILLDQIPRNIFRGTAHMYATDPLALMFARRFLDAGYDETFSPDLRLAFYLPFTHSETVADQELSVAKRRPLGPRIERKAAEHLEIIRRFGRFPHRNDMLGRETTVEERAYLDGGGFAG